ncbi:MAG: ABC transporter permease [Actinomycetota bacterium]
MFQLAYMRKELTRRWGRTVLTALGLAAGVAMVIAIIGVSQGLNEAQSKVLAPLQAIGTDILVTRVAGTVQTSTGTVTDSAPATPTATASSGQQRRAGFFGGPGAVRGPGADLNQADAAALLNENSNVVTDLSKLGKPGEKFTHDFFLSATLLSFPQASVGKISSIAGVTKAVGALTQLAQHQTGTVPNIIAEVQTGGQTVTSTVRPAPMSDAERQTFRDCVQANGGFGAGGGPGGPPEGGGGGRDTSSFQTCLPERFKRFEASVITPLRTIQQVVAPPSTDITNNSYTAAGIDPSIPSLGLVTPAQLVSGSWLSKGTTDTVLLNTAYANKSNLKVGSTMTINETIYKVVGTVNPTLTGGTADIYFPLTTLQGLAGKQDRVTQVLVTASDSASVDKVAASIKKAIPGAEVVTTKTLADQVTGSLTDAQKLADRLGGAAAIIVLIFAFAIAVLLTLSSIAKRVREIGTLRAIGWSRSRVVRQILAETFGIGVLGGALGVILGYAAAIAVRTFSPELTASSSGIPGVSSSSLGQFFGSAGVATVHTARLTLTAPVHPMTIVIGLAFALVGGLIAGAVGGWRASRLSPAEALRNLG